jgi:hypothetical protein
MLHTNGVLLNYHHVVLLVFLACVSLLLLVTCHAKMLVKCLAIFGEQILNVEGIG